MLKWLKNCIYFLPFILYGEDLFLTTKLQSLDPFSITEHCAFYELYPNTEEGEKAIARVWELLLKNKSLTEIKPSTLPITNIGPFVSMITKKKFHQPDTISEEQLEFLEKISDHLPHRSLKGHKIYNENEIVELESKEIDIGRALLVEEFGDDIKHIRYYEAVLDLMALQILIRLPIEAKAENKIQEINKFIFYEMGFRFPPHSLYAASIDRFTLLPSILDNQQGVCLGVSSLYLCLAQRVGLPLEIVTPPGHIYLRYRQNKEVINIETTARGVHFPSEKYLEIDKKSVEERTLKEVIGLVMMNQASVAWRENNYKKAISLYEKATLYLPEDPLLQLCLGVNYLLSGKINKGKALLRSLKTTETIPQDYLNGNVDENGIKIIFSPVDETYESIVIKIQQLQHTTTRYPKFRGGLFQLGASYLKIGRAKEALQIFENYHQIDKTNPIVEYYIATIAMERMDYNKAWVHLQIAEKILKTKNHTSKILRGLRTHLSRIALEP